MSSELPERIAFFLHDVSARGGQERCTLEIARRLSKRWPVEIHAYSFEPGPAGAAALRFRAVGPYVRRPFIAKSALFHVRTLGRLKCLARERRTLVHAAGGCILAADVVQMHFVHAAWHEQVASNVSLGRGSLRELYYSANAYYDRWSERRVLAGARCVVAVSSKAARDLVRHYGEPPRLHVVHHGVDTHEFRPALHAAERSRIRDRFDVAASDVLLFFAGPYERKRLDLVMMAMAALPVRLRARARLLAVGGGNRDRFAELAARLGMARAVTLLAPSANMAELYRAADLFVLPTPYDTFGMVVLEALATGLPVLVSRQAGAAELMDGNGCGEILEPDGSPESWATALAAWMDDHERRGAARVAARRVAEANTWEHAAEAYARVLEPMLVPGRSGDG